MARYTPLWEQSGSYAASVDRRLIGSLWPAAASSGGAASVIGGTMTVSLAPGAVAVPTQNNTGSTLCVWDAAEQVGPLAQGGSQPRIDVITCHPRGTDLDGGANNDFILDIIAGTAAASPAVPAVPAGQVALYQVAVAANAVSLSAGNLTDVRPGGLAVPPAVPAYNYKARMHRAAALTSAAAAVTILPFDTVSADPNGNLSTGVGAKYTCPVAGRYLVTGRFSAPVASGVRMYATIFLNGAEAARGADTGTFSAAGTAGVVVSTVIAAAVGNTLQIAYYTSAAASIEVGAAFSYMAVDLLSTP